MNGDASLRFRKMNGLGNEIVVVDLRGGSRPLTPEQVAGIARHPRTHYDQMMVLRDPRAPGTNAFIEIFNNDGSYAGACGNGMRCVGLAVLESDGTRDQRYETVAGILNVAVQAPDRISVDMGRPRFGWQDVPTRDEFADTTRIELQIGPIDDPILHSPSVCSMGNPHAVFWVDDVEAYDLARIGPLLEHHPMFPEGVNVSLCAVESSTLARVRTWERGAGLTLACGSAACAALVCAVRLGRMERMGEIHVPGGALSIEWGSDDRVTMTGPAELEHEGTLLFAEDGTVSIE